MLTHRSYAHARTNGERGNTAIMQFMGMWNRCGRPAYAGTEHVAAKVGGGLLVTSPSTRLDAKTPVLKFR